MVDYEKIKKLDLQIKKNQEKVKNESDYKKKERLRLKIKIDELKIKIERLG